MIASDLNLECFRVKFFHQLHQREEEEREREYEDTYVWGGIKIDILDQNFVCVCV